MNLKESLDAAHSKASTEAIVAWVGKDPKRFAQLTEHFLHSEPRLQIRAAWPLSYCVENHPDLVAPHLTLLVRHLQKSGTEEPVRRSILRLLQFVAIPVRLQGAVANACFAFVADPTQAPAIRAFAMTVAENLAAHSPELQRELVLILEDQLPYASPAFVSRARKVLRKWKRKPAE